MTVPTSPAAAPSAGPYADPGWFPYDLDIVGGRLHFLRLDEAMIERSIFLDVRMEPTGVAPLPVPLAEVVAALSPSRSSASSPAWLWHTSFCGSTLFARILHLAPHSVALREPMILRRLSDAADARRPIAPWLAPAVTLLARPWRPQGRVVIKPTHAALNIALPLMQAAPTSRILVLSSPLEDFMLSHLKKSAETLSKIGTLAERALRAGRFARRLPREAFAPPDPLAAAALQWAAQRELIAEWRDRDRERMLLLDWAEARRDLHASAERAAAWLQLELPVDDLRRHVDACAGVHAKAPQRRYGVEVLRQESDWLRGQYRDALADAQRWAERYVLPAMRADAMAWTDSGG